MLLLALRLYAIGWRCFKYDMRSRAVLTDTGPVVVNPKHLMEMNRYPSHEKAEGEDWDHREEHVDPLKASTWKLLYVRPGRCNLKQTNHLLVLAGVPQNHMGNFALYQTLPPREDA